MSCHAIFARAVSHCGIVLHMLLNILRGQNAILYNILYEQYHVAYCIVPRIGNWVQVFGVLSVYFVSALCVCVGGRIQQ